MVIGTHRLLSGDVGFARLGLLIVDEEQRFGVTHKEAIKTLRHDVDVLTLTATPIPRTLEMSLTGIRDMTVLQTPPADRKPIGTYVGPYDERAVVEAIRRELLRDGQVFFVHNRVADIDGVAAHLRELVPDARVAVAHGQMDEAELEQVVLDFWDRRHDVLVCTTIIESGIDMPTVNTLIVDRADLMGLAQLHQIRGRVGRAQMRAYAYLFTPPERSLTDRGLRAAEGRGRVHRAGVGDPHRHARPGDQGCGQPSGGGAVGPHRGGGLRPVLRDGDRGGGRTGGGGARAPRRDESGRAGGCAPAAGLRAVGVVAFRRLPPPRRGHERRGGGGRARRMAGPLRAAARRRRVAAGRGAVAGALRGRGCDRRVGPVAARRGSGEVRITPLRLRESRRVRLERLWPAAVYEPSSGRLRVPLRSRSAAVEAITEVLERLADQPPPAAAASPAA